ncbi:hypothetical protein H6776_01730 [Candidatus Nomurabacteria bacterium]|nr:hypothetical protein [Candidatus Nomurabacteria bacterium]
MMKKERPVIRIALSAPIIFLAWLIVIVVVGLIVFAARGDIYSTMNILRSLLPATAILAGLIACVSLIVNAVRMKERQGEEKKKPRRRFFGNLISLILIVVFVLGISLLGSTMGVGIGGTIDSSSAMYVGGSGVFRTPGRMFDTPNFLENNVTDNREFIKISYNGNIKTRKVTYMTEEAMDIIRRLGGRIDSFNSDNKYGYVSFILPKSRFEDFRDDIAELAHPKLYTEKISGQNMLDQKIALEQEEQQIIKNLASLLDSQEYLENTSSQRIARLDREIAGAQDRIALLRDTLIEVADGTNEHTQLRSYIDQYQQQLTTLRQARNQEKVNFAQENTMLVNRVSGTHGELADNEDAQQTLLDDVETVEGNLSINYQSRWNIARNAWPIRPGWVLLILLVIVKIVLCRMRLLPRVEFV